MFKSGRGRGRNGDLLDRLVEEHQMKGGMQFAEGGNMKLSPNTVCQFKQA